MTAVQDAKQAGGQKHKQLLEEGNPPVNRHRVEQAFPFPAPTAYWTGLVTAPIQSNYTGIAGFWMALTA